MITRILRSLNVMAVLVAAIALPMQALAVETTGSLKGVVQDSSGTALPGIKVTVASDALIGGPRTAVTDDQGRYRFPALPVGTYSVKAEHEGFRTAESRTYVGIGGDVTVDFDMQLPTAEETFVITDVRPVVDVEETQSGATYDDEFLSRIPSGRTYQGMTDFVAGVTNRDGNPNVHGETLYSNSYLLDGVNITDPVTHTFSTNFNFDAIDAIEIITGGYDAEYGQATGAIVNIVTKSGGNELTVDSSVYYSDFNTVSGGKKTNGDFRDMNANVNVGGPILKDKIWFFTSYEFNQVQTQPAEKVNPTTGVTVSKKPHTFQSSYFLGKITWQASPAHKIAAQLQTDPTTISNTGSNASLPSARRFPNAYGLREQGGYNTSVSWDWVINGATLLRTQVGYLDSILNELPDSRDYDLAGHQNGSTGDLYGNFIDYYWDRRQRLNANTKVTRFIDDVLGSHRLKAGIDFNQDRYPVVTGFNGDAFYIDSGFQTDANGNIVFDDAGNPVGNPDLKYEFDGALRTVTKGFLLGVFIQDDWKPMPNLTLKIGARFDHSEYQNDVGQQVLNFNTIAPRLFVSWDPTKDQKTVITGGYAQSYDNGSLLVPSFVNRRGTTGRIYEWDGSQYSYAGDYGGEALPYKKMRAPVKNEVQVGAQRELAANLALGGRLIFARTQYYFEDDEANLIWNADGSDAIGFKDGVDHYVFSLGTPQNSYRDYRGIEITLTKALANGWLVEGNYTLGDARGTNEAPISYFADNPVQNKYLADGELSYNVANALKIQTSKELPYGFNIGASYYFETGSPYDRIYYNTYYADYYDYRSKPGQFHYEPFERIDMRGSYTRKFGRHTLTAYADVFNILDRRVVTLRDTAYDPELADDHPDQPFGTILDKQNPLRARFGLRYNF